MNDPSDQTPDGNVNTGEAASSELGGGGSRRRFIKGGAAAAPVILTFTSRPVLGFEKACMTPSRMISGNHSGLTDPVPCRGSARSTWAGELANENPDWAKLKFTDVFGMAYQTTGNANLEKLGPVLLDSIAGNDKLAVAGFASYIIAAWLNATVDGGVESVVAVLKPEQVIHMWNDIVLQGKFCPQLPPMCWNATGVIGYLTNSGIVPA